MSEKHCTICGQKREFDYEYYNYNFEGHSLPVCYICNQAIKRLKSSSDSNRSKGSAYLRNQLENGKADSNGIPLVKSLLGETISDKELENMNKAKIEARVQESSSANLVFYIIGVIFIITTFVFHSASVNNSYGVANIQGTVYAAASAIIAIICFAAGAIVTAIKNK